MVCIGVSCLLSSRYISLSLGLSRSLSSLRCHLALPPTSLREHSRQHCHPLLPRTYGLRVRRASANVSDVRLCRLQRNAGVAH
jgi:hypothetical protein